MKDLTQGNIHKSFLAYSIPVIISSVLTVSFGIVDTSIAGHFLGARGLAATGATNSYFAVLMAMLWGLNWGVATYVARAFAAKQYRALKRILMTNLLILVSAVSILMLISLLLRKPILSFMNVDPEIWEDAKVYFVILCFHKIISMATHLLSICTSAMGNTTFPLFVAVLEAVLNICGNLLSVTVLDLGVLGIGLSTLFSSAVALVCYWIRFRGCFKEMRVAHIRVRPKWIYFTSLLSYTLPNGFQQLAMYLVGFLMAPLRNGLGYVAVATNSVTSQIWSLHGQIYYASCRAGGNYISQCIGAKKYHKIKPAVGVAMLHATMFVLPIMICVVLCPQFVCSWFLDAQEEPEVLRYSVIYIRYFLPFSALQLICAVFHSALRGVKSVKHLFVGSMVGALAKLGASYLLIGQFGLIGLFAAGIVGNAAECAYVLILYFTGYWLPKDIRLLVHTKHRHQTQ